MQNILRNPVDDNTSSSPWVLLLFLLGYTLAALFIFSLIANLIILPFFDFDAKATLSALSNPFGDASNWLPLMILQGITAIGTFIMVPIFFVKRHLSGDLGSFFTLPIKPSQPILLTLLIMFCFMVANSILIEWNQQMVLPEWLSGFEQWALSKEAQLEKLTEFLTDFGSFPKFLLAFVVIAIVPAIGEELLFRGLLQNLLLKAVGNYHVAIWLAAILFGIFHFQFYGVLPRIMLGALFGYIYVWSGRLSLAMIGHFLNNGLTLTLLYFSQIGWIDFDPSTMEDSPPIYLILIFFIGGIFLLYTFKKYFVKEQNG